MKRQSLGPRSRPSSACRCHVTNSTDDATEAHLRGLHPRAEQLVRDLLINLRGIGLEGRVRSGLRTYAQQDALYARGRPGGPPGPIVTLVKGGESFHNFGLAADITIYRGGAPAAGASNLYRLAGLLGEDLGFTWGGSFQHFYDPGHFQLDMGYSKAVIRLRFEMGLDPVGGP